jgi:hypothetical protein
LHMAPSLDLALLDAKAFPLLSLQCGADAGVSVDPGHAQKPPIRMARQST